MWNPSRLRRLRTSRLPVANPNSRLRPEIRATAVLTVDGKPQKTRGLVDVEYSFSRADLQPILGAIRETLGCGPVPLDSPARLEDALRHLIATFGGRGEPRVRRSPAALLTPEYWSISINRIDARTLRAMGDFIERGQAE